MAKNDTVLSLADKKGNVSVTLDATKGNVDLGGGGHNGDIYMMNADGDMCVHIDGGNSNLMAGGYG
ncbi:MAG: hypothetical protein AAFO75_09560, partial [Pseudomonadota bacterium]